MSQNLLKLQLTSLQRTTLPNTKAGGEGKQDPVLARNQTQGLGVSGCVCLLNAQHRRCSKVNISQNPGMV